MVTTTQLEEDWLKQTKVKVTSLKDEGYIKCPRCWHYHNHFDNFGHRPGDVDEKGKQVDQTEKLCDKCTHIILEYHQNHESIPYILEQNRKTKRHPHSSYEN